MSRAIFILPPYDSDLNSYNLPPWQIGRIPPVGLIMIASYLEKKGHAVKVIDSRALIMEHNTGNYIPIILKIIDDFKPEFVGINILTALFNEARKLSSEIKSKYPGLLIIAGGVHPSVEPELTFQQNEYIDAICIGAGEEVCLDILEGRKSADIQGLLCRDHRDRFVARPLEPNIDKYPFPDYKLGDSHFYTAFTVDTLNGWGYRGLGVLTSRSCPYSCKFCASDWSKPFRYHSPEYVVEMAKYLSNYDIDVITFYDDTIAAIKNRLYEICRGFINNKIFYPHRSLRWFAAMRANQVDPDMLKLMKEAGCFGVSMGIESGSDKMLEVINKKTTVEMNKKACSYIKEAGLSLSYSLMLGIPGETEKEMKETIAFMREMPCQSKGIGSFRPLPGSPFYSEFINSGRLIKNNINWSNLGNFTIMPDTLFCDVSKDKFAEIFDEAQSLAYQNRWVAIHEDTIKHIEDFKNIASSTRIKLSKLDHYESSAHVAYKPFSAFLIYDAFLATLRDLLPYQVKKRLRTFLKTISRKK